jgi:hypothetical protein
MLFVAAGRTHPMRANTMSSCGSNGKSMVKLVAYTAVTVAAQGEKLQLSRHRAPAREV